MKKVLLIIIILVCMCSTSYAYKNTDNVPGGMWIFTDETTLCQYYTKTSLRYSFMTPRLTANREPMCGHYGYYRVHNHIIAPAKNRSIYE